MSPSLIDRAAEELRKTSRAFTRKNLYYEAARRLSGAPPGFDAFCAGPLARRLRAGPIEGLLPPPRRMRTRGVLPREWAAYFPAAILMVDRPEIVDLFAASGALVQARIAPVCIDGTPRPVVRWLCEGLRAGHRAPIGFLHDADTVVYPYAFEPLATLVRLSRGAPVEYRDLGLPPEGGASDPLGLARAYEQRVRDVEELPPASLVAWASARLLAALPPDPWLLPIRQTRRSP